MKLIVKILKFIKNFIIDFWFFHLLEVIWLTPTIYTLIAHPEPVIVRILLCVILLLCGIMEGYLLYMELDDWFCRDGKEKDDERTENN